MTIPLGLQALGVVTPLGCGKNEVARALFAGTRAGLVPSSDRIPDKSVYVGAVAGALPEAPPELSAFDCRNNRLMLAALMEVAGDVADAADRFGRDRIAVVVGTSTSGIAEAEAAFATCRSSGDWPVEFDYRQLEAGGLAEFTVRWLGLTGPAYTIVTACSSSAKVFGSARRLIAAGVCDAAVVGGADSICGLTLNGFDSLEALSKERCNPFSANRDGINIGEGAAAFLLTGEAGPVDLLGVGETSDAYHISAPEPSGVGAVGAMRAALEDAEIGSDAVAYINLHGTATRLNDEMESRAVAGLFPDGVPCSSTKSMTGHMLGAAGACEAAFLWLTLNTEFGSGQLPPHLWDDVADPELPSLDLVAPGTGYADKERVAMLGNSFAFGGNNVALLFGRGWR